MRNIRMLVGMLLVGRTIQAAELTFPIVTDTYMDSLNAPTNYGVATAVKALINSSDGSVCRGLFQLPPEVGSYDTGKLASATVCFHVWNDQTAGRHVTLYPLTRSFAEGTGNADGASWNTFDGTQVWSNVGGDFDTNFPVVGVRGADGYFRWDITPLLTNATVRAHLLSCGALLQIDETPVPSSGTPRAPFTSSDSANAEKPYVRLTLAARVGFPIAADAYLDSRSSNAGRNYGAATTVKALINSSDSSVCRGLFRLPSEMNLYATGQIAKATVRFYVWQDNTTNRLVTLYPLTRAFVEGTGNGATNADGATWTTCDGTVAWTASGGDYDTNFPVVGVKEDILDPEANDRFFSWDITALLTNRTSREELLNYGALLQIDEVPVPAGSMPRAPFTSSDDLAYAEAYRPQVQLLVIPHTASVSCVSVDGAGIVLSFSDCTPYVTNRIERSFDLQQSDGWALVTNLVTSGSDTNWMESFQTDWTNAYYRVTSDE